MVQPYCMHVNLVTVSQVVLNNTLPVSSYLSYLCGGSGAFMLSIIDVIYFQLLFSLNNKSNRQMPLLNRVDVYHPHQNYILGMFLIIQQQHNQNSLWPSYVVVLFCIHCLHAQHYHHHSKILSLNSKFTSTLLQLSPEITQVRLPSSMNDVSP